MSIIPTTWIDEPNCQIEYIDQCFCEKVKVKRAAGAQYILSLNLNAQTKVAICH